MRRLVLGVFDEFRFDFRGFWFLILYAQSEAIEVYSATLQVMWAVLFIVLGAGATRQGAPYIGPFQDTLPYPVWGWIILVLALLQLRFVARDNDRGRLVCAAAGTCLWILAAFDFFVALPVVMRVGWAGILALMQVWALYRIGDFAPFRAYFQLELQRQKHGRLLDERQQRQDATQVAQDAHDRAHHA